MEAEEREKLLCMMAAVLAAAEGVTLREAANDAFTLAQMVREKLYDLGREEKGGEVGDPPPAGGFEERLGTGGKAYDSES